VRAAVPQLLLQALLLLVLLLLLLLLEQEVRCLTPLSQLLAPHYAWA
jgi:hypothetical protein